MRKRVPALAAEPRPFQDLNITPLIDVMLVLLVMFILLIPIQYNQIPVDLPSGPGVPQAQRPIERVSIGADGAIRWNGVAISEASLAGRFGALVEDPAEPILQIAADGGARYDPFARTLSAAKKAGVRRIGFVDNAKFAGEL